MSKELDLNDEEETVSADGVENSEHVLDILQEIDMLKGNISDNTDLGISLFKFHKKNKDLDEDTLDAVQLACEKIIEVEKTVEGITKLQSQIDVKDEEKLKSILEEIRRLEEISKKTLESILN